MYTIIHKNSKTKGYEFKDRVIEKVRTYFEEVLKAIKKNDEARLKVLSRHIHEAKYTCLGYSQEGPGKGFGTNKFTNLVSSIKKVKHLRQG